MTSAMIHVAPRFLLRCSDAPHIHFVLVKAISVVGRKFDCDIVIDHPSVSRQHAELHIKSQALHVVDLKSTNGTFVGSQRVENIQVVPGQVVRFGGTVFVVDEFTESLQLETGFSGVSRKDQCNESDTINQMPLTFAKDRVLRLLLQGLQEKEIAFQLDLSLNTVHSHTKAIYRAYGVHTRSELLLLFQRKRGSNQNSLLGD
jgi:DNA-binding CsgD family transcriptional regulator